MKNLTKCLFHRIISYFFIHGHANYPFQDVWMKTDYPLIKEEEKKELNDHNNNSVKRQKSRKVTY